MIVWAAIFVGACLLFFAGIALFALRHWICAFALAFVYRMDACFPRHISAENKNSTLDVLVVFNDPAFPNIDITNVVKYFDNGVIVYYVNVNYLLRLDAKGHALQALGSIAEKRGIAYHFDQHPAFRYTFLGIGVGGIIAAYCAQRMPMDINTYSTIQYQKNRVRVLLVGTPTGGCRKLYNFAFAPFIYNPEICDLLDPKTGQLDAFWDDVGVLHHVYMLCSKNDIRCALSHQQPPPLFRRFIEIDTVTGVPWYGLLTEKNTRAALTYLWDFTHL